MSVLPELEHALEAAARRRFAGGRRRLPRPSARRLRPALALAAAAALVALGAGMLGRAGDEREAVPGTPLDRWTSTAVPAWGVEGSLPPGWTRAAESLTPRLVDPREVFSAGTFPLRAADGGCHHLPAGALAAMGPADAFVSVQERGRGAAAGGFPPRPPAFAAAATMEPAVGSHCALGVGGATASWFSFADASRSFHALVVTGPDAPAGVRADAFGILDRLRFDPARQPDWDASP
jgi:hypothetical protein